jgi:hypothetical protein
MPPAAQPGLPAGSLGTPRQPSNARDFFGFWRCGPPGGAGLSGQIFTRGRRALYYGYAHGKAPAAGAGAGGWGVVVYFFLSDVDVITRQIIEWSALDAGIVVPIFPLRTTRARLMSVVGDNFFHTVTKSLHNSQLHDDFFVVEKIVGEVHDIVVVDFAEVELNFSPSRN